MTSYTVLADRLRGRVGGVCPFYEMITFVSLVFYSSAGMLSARATAKRASVLIIFLGFEKRPAANVRQRWCMRRGGV